MAEIQRVRAILLVCCQLTTLASMAQVDWSNHRFAYQYMGCYADFSGGQRDLNGLSGIRHMGEFSIGSFGGISTPKMSAEYCSRVCAVGGFLFFGMQFYEECYCGNAYGSQGHAIETDCRLACRGNASQICGGSNRNSVYALHYSSCPRFFESARQPLTLWPDRNTTTWQILVKRGCTLAQCLLLCGRQTASVCRAVLYSANSSNHCIALRYALVPAELGDGLGLFLVRVL